MFIHRIWNTMEMCEAYKKSRVVVVPSVLPEPFGMVALEALSHGRPVVGFNVGGLKEVIAKGGLFAEYANPKDLAEKILYFIRDRRFAEEKGREGYEYAKVYFSPENHIEKLLEIIKG